MMTGVQKLLCPCGTERKPQIAPHGKSLLRALMCPACRRRGYLSRPEYVTEGWNKAVEIETAKKRATEVPR